LLRQSHALRSGLLHRISARHQSGGDEPALEHHLHARDIRWIFSHAGGAVPILAGRINSLAKIQKTNADSLPDGIDFELKRLYYETANAAYAPNMAALLKYVPISQVLFGSDYPYVSVTENVSDLGKVGLSVDDLRALESDNAMRLISRLKA
jgi:6-methylsalicylate decarboxylase